MCLQPIKTTNWVNLGNGLGVASAKMFTLSGGKLIFMCLGKNVLK
jgi:hypothetical protein